MSDTTGVRPTRARWFPILGLVFVATLINYLDRAVFSIARPLFTKELDISPLVAGTMGSAFSWSYALAQIPGGAVLDRYGTRMVYGVSLITWSVMTMLQGMVSTVGAFIGLRVGLGVCEAPCFPANSRVLNSWFPQHERARATSIYSVGLSAGLAFFLVPLFWIAEHYTWRGLFIVAGAIGILFGIVWYAYYREPRESTFVNQAELDYIAAGGGFAKVGIAQTPVSWANILKVSKLRPILIISIAQFCANTVLTFFLIDFVNYLATQRHMAWIKLGIFVSFPFMAAAVGGLVGGAAADWIIKRGGSISFARKLPVALGLTMASSLVLANWVPEGQDSIVIAIMSVAFFGQGMSNLGWTVLTDLAPKSMLGLAGGFFNMITNLAGILTPLILGVILQATGSYFYSLIYVAIVPLIGAALYVFALGEIKRLEVPE
ncbi:MAG TPA: MFS transporter [Vicinamibacterales bacterium]|nr:MFS transporter [Vicinamibacterales bacterium]